MITTHDKLIISQNIGNSIQPFNNSICIFNYEIPYKMLSITNQKNIQKENKLLY